MASLGTKAEKLAQAAMSRRALIDTPGFTLDMPPDSLRKSNPELYAYLVKQRETLVQWQSILTQQLITIRGARPAQ